MEDKEEGGREGEGVGGRGGCLLAHFENELKVS